MEESLKKLIGEYDLDSAAEHILGAATPAIQIIKQPSRDDFVSTSRLGGLPDVSPGFVWPRHEGRPLSLLAQINCSEITRFDREHVLPNSGLLHFFYDVENPPWGFDPKAKGGAIVRWVAPNSLMNAVAPSDLKSKVILPGIPIAFRPFLSLPSYGSACWDVLALAEDQTDAYFEMYGALREAASAGHAAHQVLGHSDNIQGDMQLECQLVSHGLYCGDATGYNDPRRKELEAGAAEWRLLLQLDSDEDLNVMWGDCGMVYFWIRDTDLKERHFEHAWAVLQCS